MSGRLFVCWRNVIVCRSRQQKCVSVWILKILFDFLLVNYFTISASAAGAQCSCIMFAFARFRRIFHCCSVAANEGDGVASRIGIQLLFVCAIICALQFTQRHRDTTTTIWSQMTNKEEKYKGRCNWIECWNMHLLCGYTAESGDSFVMEAENVRHWHCDT